MQYFITLFTVFQFVCSCLFRTLPLSSITLSKPSALSSAATSHSLVTLTTTPSTTSIIPGATSYIKLSLGPTLTLAGNTSLLVPPKTASGSGTVPKTSFPVTLTTKPSGAQPASGIQFSKQGAVVTQVGGQTMSVIKPSDQVALATTGSVQDSKVTKTKAQSTIASRLGASMVTKESIPVTIVTKSVGLGSTTAKKSTQNISRTSGVTIMATKSSGLSVMAAKTSVQSTVGSKSSAQPATTSKIKGQIITSTKSSVLPGMVPKTNTCTAPKTSAQATLTSKGQSVLTTKSSGLVFAGSKGIAQSSMANKIISRPIIATKVGGQAVFTLSSKLGGQSTAATTKGGQAATTTKLGGQVVTTKASGLGTVASRLTGQGLTLSGQGMSAAAVLSRLAAPGRAAGEGVTISSTTPSRITTITMHGGTTTHLSVVKETKKLLTGQKPTSTQGSSLLKKNPEPVSKSDDPYHFDD